MIKSKIFSSITNVGAICIVIGFLFLPDLGFAQEESTMKSTMEVVNIFLKFLSWFRVVPATIAGELLSNDLVFGSFINLENYLRKIRNIMRSFANFFLGGLFLYYLLAQIFQSVQGVDIGNFVKKLLKIFAAAILVNMSFFLMRTVVDLSIVATAAISSLPHSIIESRREGLAGKIKVKKRYCANSRECDQQESQEVGLSSILPDAGNMGGPIVFMGVAMLNLLDAEVIPEKIQNRENIALVTATKLIMILMFTAPILALMIVNMIRIFYIRLWTIFSPFIIVDLVLKAGQDDSPLKDVREKLKYSNLGDVMGLIFVPVVVVGTLALGFILMLGLTSVIKGGDQYATWSLSNLQLSGTPATLNVPRVVSIGIDGELFQETGFRTLGLFGEAIMVFFSMAILRGMVKIGFSFSKIASEYSTMVFNGVGSAAKMIPIPLAGGLTMGTIDREGGSKAFIKKFTGMRAIESNSEKDAQKYRMDITKKFGIQGGGFENDLSPDDFAKITSTSVGDITAIITDGLRGKASVSYAGNVKDAFEKINLSDLQKGYFSTMDTEHKKDMGTLSKTLGRQEFVSDVIGGKTLGSYKNTGANTMKGTTFEGGAK